jgi:hypothetical protein
MLSSVRCPAEKAKLRLVSRDILDTDKESDAAKSAPNGNVAYWLISAAQEGKRIQKLMNFQTAVVDVDFSLPPTVRMSFLSGKAEKGEGHELSIEALDIACWLEFGGK